MLNYKIAMPLMRWPGETGWHYVLLPPETYEDIQEIGKAGGRGFGAVKVEARIKDVIWQTSVFPDSEQKQYILFIKKSVRKACGLTEGEQVEATVAVVQTV